MHTSSLVNICVIGLTLACGLGSMLGAAAPLSPADMATSADGAELYVAEETGRSLAVIKTDDLTLKKRIPLEFDITGVACYKDKLLITTRNQLGELAELDPRTGKVLRAVKVGQGARSPVVDEQRQRAYVCNYFKNTISVINLESFQEIVKIPVLRLPSDADLGKDGKYLYVANLLPEGPANVEDVAAKVSVIDTTTNKVTRHIDLANGSNALRALKTSPDGRFVCITHNLARFSVPTTQLDRGWINTSGLSFIDTSSHTHYATVLLDDVSKGAAGSWGVDFAPDASIIYVAHSGTHEISVIHAEQLLEKIAKVKDRSDLEYDLSVMTGIRKRVALQGNGPRAIVAHSKGVYAAQYFSDEVVKINIEQLPVIPKVLNLNPDLKLSEERKGEIFFNDARHCFQQWQSCNGCHPDQARVDALNWDLLNDGIGNPKNVKSLLFSHVTPPAMITGIRADAETAVRAGVKYIQFTQATKEEYKSVDAYLKSLKPEPSPYLVDGKLSEAATRGKKVFEDFAKGNCMSCHNGPYFTDGKKHNMHNADESDRTSLWDTPTLREVWRTGPYFHDGRSPTILHALKNENHAGAANRIDDQEMKELVEYVLSL